MLTMNKLYEVRASAVAVLGIHRKPGNHKQTLDTMGHKILRAVEDQIKRRQIGGGKLPGKCS